jgi:uncharacterized protein (TIGR02646 family)
VRRINNLGISVPEGWQTRCDDAKCKVANGEVEPGALSTIWKALKDALAELSHDKCWYCEIVQERSDNNVDHFRPKDHYKWLAFEVSNFRYACTFCNSLRRNPGTGETEGKGDHFPLLDPSKKANNAGEERGESPLLLDPCQTQDPGLLDFDADDGRPRARYPNNETKKLRAEASIKLYHLDHPALVEKRRVLGAQIRERIDRANDLMDQCETGHPAIDRAFGELIRDLSDAISEKAELSVFARKVIAGQRDEDKEWIDDILRTA